jgi:hypothetical protein
VRAGDNSEIDELRERLDDLGWSITHRTNPVADVIAERPSPAQRTKTGNHAERLAGSIVRLALAGLEPAIEIDDWSVLFGCSRREVERLRAAGKLPPPDLRVGKSPKWLAALVRKFLEKQARGGTR